MLFTVVDSEAAQLYTVSGRRLDIMQIVFVEIIPGDITHREVCDKKMQLTQ